MYYEKWLDFIAIFHNFCKLILRCFPIYVAIQRKKTGNTYKMHEYCDTVNCIKIQYFTNNTEDDFKINILPASRESRGFQEVPGTNRSFGHRTPYCLLWIAPYRVDRLRLVYTVKKNLSLIMLNSLNSLNNWNNRRCNNSCGKTVIVQV